MEDTFWRGFWVGTASGTAAGLIVLFVPWLIGQLIKRFSQRHLNRLGRFEAQLKQHRREQRNLGAVALHELFYFIFQIILATGVIAAIFAIGLIELLASLKGGAAPQPEELERITSTFSSIMFALAIWTLALTLGSLRRIVMFLNFADWRENRIINRIKQLKPDWKDPDSIH